VLEEYSAIFSRFGIAQMDGKVDGVIVTKESPELTIRLIGFSHVDFDMYYTSNINRIIVEG
jgi:hypothetical protein